MVVAQGGFSEFHERRVVSTLGDIDDSFFAFFMNRTLFDRLAEISIFANAYLLWRASSEELEATAPNSVPLTPWAFSEAELNDQWVRVGPKGFTGGLHFSEMTPRRLWAARELEATS